MTIETEKKKTFDVMWLGTFLGMLVPLLSLIVVYLTKFSKLTSLTNYFRFLIENNGFPQLLSLCALPNLLVFFIFIWTDRLRSARGVVLSTFIIVIAVAIMKIF